jgi:hypothetical protein
MALLKDKQFKGINTPYHKIVDCNVKTGFVGVASYVNEEAAKIRNNMLGGRMSYKVDFPVDVETPLAYAYAQVKVSDVTTDEESGEETENNFLTDAIDN